MSARSRFDVDRLGEGFTLVIRYAHQFTVGFFRRRRYNNTSCRSFYIFITERGDRNIKVLFLRAVIYGYLDSSARYTHGEIELCSDAGVFIALFGTAVP